jgi:hypothetical protein
MKVRNLLIWGLPALLLLIQLFRIERDNPPVVSALDFRTVMEPPPDVQGILENACYDCHSHETRYPWYSQVAPFSWLLKNHIDEGREHLNFSTFGALSVPDRAEALDEMAEETEEGHMPPNNYVWLHAGAKLSREQLDRLIGWLRGSNPRREEYGGTELIYH